MTLKTILVVEDEPHIQRLIQTNLKRAGYGVRQAMTGSEALTELEIERPDVLILDMTLPDIEYYMLLTKLKQNAFTRTVPIIVLSHKPREGEVFRGGGGVDAYLNKPFNPMDLISFVKRILGETDGRRLPWVCVF
ncbi:MAG: Response regulator consisting of a CheY-like receiver domain and a winged-helix DNA-binding domain [Chthonomonadaceae bacterium]|nr:Response regulator consisting of a CheY-like receiver domain and a winged-helix DNA-binding domain [Chthonomonadaceae bacterium]